MTLPPDPFSWPGDAPGGPGGPGGSDPWMTITDVFRIAGRGTVVTGKLQGTVPLSITDALSCEGSVFQISGIEQFRATLTTVEPPAEIGVLLRDNPPADQLRGRTVSFVPGGAATTTPFTTEPPRKHRWRR